MSKTIDLTDEQYATLERVAADRGQTPTRLLAELIRDVGHSQSGPRRYETDDWFRHLGMTDDEIADVKRELRREAESVADA